MKKPNSTHNLKRAIQPMPDFVRNKLELHGLMKRYSERPAYQRNDYLSWINRAVRQATREKRLARMLEELDCGTHYMGMKWRAKK